jgi:spermidine synthase
MSRAPATGPWPEVTLSEAAGVRYLHLGSEWVQGAMRVRQPLHVELEYVQRMLAVLLWRDPSRPGQGHAVQLGLGAGALTRFTLRALRMRSTAVELNPQVIQVCRDWFGLPADAPRLTMACDDASAWLRQAEPGSASLLFVDLYDEDAAAPVLDDQGFYDDCRRLLADGGVMAVNLFGRDARFLDSIGHIAAAFGADAVWGLQPTREGNTVVLASRDAPLPEPPVLAARAAELERRYGVHGLPARKWLRMLRRFQLPTTPAGEVAADSPNPDPCP